MAPLAKQIIEDHPDIKFVGIVTMKGRSYLRCARCGRRATVKGLDEVNRRIKEHKCPSQK